MSPMKAILSFAVIAAVVFSASAEEKPNKVNKRYVYPSYAYGAAVAAPAVATSVYHSAPVAPVYHAAPVASVYRSAYSPYVAAAPAYYHAPVAPAFATYHAPVASAVSYHAPLSSGVSTIYH